MLATSSLRPPAPPWLTEFFGLAAMAIAAITAGASTCFATDDDAITSALTRPDRGRSSVESADAYTDAVQKLREADAEVVHAREQGIKDLQSGPEYLSAVKELDTTYAAFNDKKNALLTELEKKDPRCAPMKKQVAEIDAELDAARQNPATPLDKLEGLYKARAIPQHQWEAEVDDAIKRENLEPLRQQWQAASEKLTALREQQKTDVENSDKLKAAKAMAIGARAAADQARAALDGPPPAEDTQEDRADDYIRQFPRFGFAGNDAWWTYGWSPIYTPTAPIKPAAVK